MCDYDIGAGRAKDSMTISRANWAGNYTYQAEQIACPDSIDSLAELVCNNDRVRAVGSRHCFNDIADTNGVLVSMRNLNRIYPVDPATNTVTCEGGVTYGELCPILQQSGYALPNLASLPHISIVGACATATHGSGNHNGNLATSVAGLEIVLPDGSMRNFTRQNDPVEFPGLVVNLGAAGIVSRVTLNVVPTFEVSQYLFRNLELDAALSNFEAIESLGYSVSLFTDWRGNRINQVWIKRRTSDSAEPISDLYGAEAADRKLHPVESVGAEPCTEQLGVPGPWHQRLPHFKMEFTPSVGEELQTEYLIPRHHAVEAVLAVGALSARISPLLQICEIRTIAADDLWMSPCYQQDCIGIHFTWLKRQTEVEALLRQIEGALAVLGARPHWGKLFTMPSHRIRPLYPRSRDFLQLIQRLDPDRKFWNAYLDRTLSEDEISRQ